MPTISQLGIGQRETLRKRGDEAEIAELKQANEILQAAASFCGRPSSTGHTCARSANA
ncbi:hypothetical protein [Streptomyces sp. HC307]|uniref:hypothetical protein n=1 Tax=Streptomyces flavusporus TaxID=3385496 RepID=UPI003917639B